ncbi:MAG: SUMF1/EgtB/PvdO family nonheme iron enzyme [Planctomycetota bacterium]
MATRPSLFRRWASVRIRRLAHRDFKAGRELETLRVIRGGSFLCHQTYCTRYRVSARTGEAVDTGTSNIGFRCARDAN